MNILEAIKLCTLCDKQTPKWGHLQPLKETVFLVDIFSIRTRLEDKFGLTKKCQHFSHLISTIV